METNELLQSISDMMDQKLEPIHTRLDKVDSRLDKVDSRLDKVDSRLDELEEQIKHTEQNLRKEIVKSENLILDEVSRVHHILNEHIADKNVHIA